VVAFARVDRAGREQHQTSPIAPIERQLCDLLRLDDSPDGRRVAIKRRRSIYDVDGLLDRADFERDIECARLADFELDVLQPRLFEARRFDRHGVLADRQEVDDVEACLVGGGLPLQAGGQGLRGHFGTWQDAAFRVADCALQRGAAGLRLCDADGKQHKVITLMNNLAMVLLVIRASKW
jgi:hypothetical protein